jgi:hypothetical protein
MKAESEVRQIMEYLATNGQHLDEIRTAVSQIQAQLSTHNK